MKVKKFISVILSVIILFCSVVTVSAAGNTVDDKYIYYGDLSEGVTTVWTGDEVYDLFVYYTFTMSEDGYFYLHYGTPHITMDTKIVNEDNCIENNYYETFFWEFEHKERIYKLNKGEYKLLIDVFDSFMEVDVYAGCLEGAITDISFGYDMIEDTDILCWSDEFESYADAVFTFSSGKTYNFTDGTLYGTFDNEFKYGKNDITIDFLGSEIKSTATVYPISHYISDVEVNSIEDYYDKTIEYFDHADFCYPENELIYITFTDGSTRTIVGSESVKLPNGNSYDVTFDSFYDMYFANFGEGNCALEIEIGYQTVKTYYFNGTKASLAENVNLLTDEIKKQNYWIAENLQDAFKNASDSETAKEYIDFAFWNWLEKLFTVFNFCFYYSTFSFIRI